MTASLSYWDLSERERAALTREDVEKYLAFELMAKGVGIRLTTPDLLPTPELSVKPRDYFGLTVDGYYGYTVLFETRDQAEQFLALRPLCKKHDHLEDVWIDHAVPVTEEIKSVSVIAPADFNLHRSALQANAKAKAENEKRQQEYEKAVKAQEAALKGLWDDWYACGRKALDHDKVKRTWEQYVTMAGSEELAAKFLLKVFSLTQIDEAAVWFGIEIPVSTTDVAPATKPEPAPAAAGDDISF